jgi:hypothetical protein
VPPLLMLMLMLMMMMMLIMMLMMMSVAECAAGETKVGQQTRIFYFRTPTPCHDKKNCHDRSKEET